MEQKEKHNPELQEAVRLLKKKALEIGQDISNRDIAEKMEWDESSVSKYLTGKVRMSKPFMLKFKEAYGIDLSPLNQQLTKSSEISGIERANGKLINVQTLNKPTHYLPEPMFNTAKGKGVPYLGEIDVFAAKINLSTFHDFQEYITDWLDVPGFRDCTCFINVSGDSMTPKFHDRDIIGIKLIQPESIDFGKPHILVTKEVPYFKFLRRPTDKKKWETHWRLVPGNIKEYDEFDFLQANVINLFWVKGKVQIKFS